MIKLLKPIISLWRLRKKTKNITLAYYLLPKTYTPVFNSEVSVKGNFVFFEKYDKQFSKEQLKMFQNHGELLLKFIKSDKIFFINPKGDNEKVLVRFNTHNICFYAKEYDNLKVLEEVFIDQVYDFTGQEHYVVCDVGMNVAAASLFFASYENVERVYSFEPFSTTYAMALANLQMNPALSKKIETMNFGLGIRDEWIEAPLQEEGSLGGTTDPLFAEKAYKPGYKRIRVEIKNIIPILKNIRNIHPQKKIILKLDCEGAEYDIIEEMESNKMISEIAIFMIEYHFRGKKILRDVFGKNNFITLSAVDENISEFGMLYAINTD